MIEQDVIGHLIDVERQAFDVLIEAETEADKRKAVAKEQAEQEFRFSYEKIITELEALQTEGQLACDSARKSDYTAFTDHLSSIVKDTPAFDAYLNSNYFGQ